VGLQPYVALPVDVVHLLAMGGWLGGLVTLMVLLRPSGLTNTAAPAMPPGAVVRFSLVATGCITILIATGCYQSWRQLGSWAAFGATDYGRLLAIKLGIVTLMLGAASVSRRWVNRHRRVLMGVGAATRAAGGSIAGSAGGGLVGAATQRGAVPEGSGVRRSVLTEAALGVLVLSVTALLVNAEPGRTALLGSSGPTEPGHRVVRYDTGGPGGRGELIVDVDPAATGPNTIHVIVEDPDGIPRDVPEVRTEMTLTARALGPFAIPLQHIGSGEYDASGVQLPYPGAWKLRITVRTSDIDETTVDIPVVVAG
jgi:copper transport protein